MEFDDIFYLKTAANHAAPNGPVQIENFSLLKLKGRPCEKRSQMPVYYKIVPWTPQDCLRQRFCFIASVDRRRIWQTINESTQYYGSSIYIQKTWFLLEFPTLTRVKRVTTVQPVKGEFE